MMEGNNVTVNRPDASIPEHITGVTAAEGYENVPQNMKSIAKSPAVDPIPPKKNEQSYTATNDRANITSYVSTGDDYYPYKVIAPKSAVTHDFTGVNQTISGFTTGRNLLLEQSQIPGREPLFGWAPQSLLPLNRDDARNFTSLYKLPAPDPTVAKAPYPVHPIGSRNPIYPLPVQHMRGVTDPDFALPEYSVGSTHGLITIGGDVLDEDNITLYPSGAARTKSYRNKIITKAYAKKGLFTTNGLPMSALDLVHGSEPLIMNKQPMIGDNGDQGRPAIIWGTPYTGTDTVGTNNAIVQRGFPTFSGPDDISRKEVVEDFEFSPQWQNTPPIFLLEEQTGVPGSIYKTSNMANGETGSCRSATMYRPSLDVIGIDQFPNRPSQWTVPPGSGVQQNNANLRDILLSTASNLDYVPQYQGVNEGDAFSMVGDLDPLAAESQRRFLDRNVAAIIAPENQIVSSF